MRLILSRKSFDSAYGRKANPIFTNGSLLPLPIPAGKRNVSRINFNSEKYDPTEYKDIMLPGDLKKFLEQNNIYNIKNYAELMLNLFKDSTAKKIVKLKKRLRASLNEKRKCFCHLDPDLIYENLERLRNWRGLFGPSSRYQKNLKEEIKKNDLILFFGTFRHVLIENGQIRYARKTDQGHLLYHEKHIIYGYLQIEDIITKSSALKPWMYKPYSHPHLDKKLWERKQRGLYLARKNLYLDGKKTVLPGYGVFRFNPELILTEKGETKSIWKKKLFPKGSKITHQGKLIDQSKWNKNGCFKWDSFGQEFIIKENSVFENHVKEELF